MIEQFIKDFTAHAWLACGLTIAIWLAGLAAQGKLLPFLARFSPWTRTVMLLAITGGGVVAGSVTAGETWSVAIPRGIGPLIAALLAHYIAAPPAPPSPPASKDGPKAGDEGSVTIVSRIIAVGLMAGLMAATFALPGCPAAWTALRDATGAVCPIVVQAEAPEFAAFPICTTVEEIERAIQSLVSSGKPRASISRDELYHEIVALRTKAGK